MQMQCFSTEVGTEYLNITEKKYFIQREAFKGGRLLCAPPILSLNRSAFGPHSV
jgi:hypothetical protein